MIYGNRAWVRDHPVATKRFLRAVYKAAAFCDADPEEAARQLVERGFARRYDYALQTIEEVPYDLWREYDPEDTLRFLRAPPARGGHDQQQPQHAHRRRLRLALRRRAQARAEGVSHASGACCPSLKQKGTSMQIAQNRRGFLASASLAAAAGSLGARGSLAEAAPPETTTVRLSKIPGVCIAPQYVVEELLRAEGFAEIRYVAVDAGRHSERMARGELDFSLNFAAPLVLSVDAGDPVKVVAGVHSGCFELFANERIRSVVDLKGKSVGVQGLGSIPHVFLAVMATYVGLDPVADIDWVSSPSVRPKELFAEGKMDAFLGFPPEPQELRARNIGHVILNSAIDRPWSQYFCCLLSGSAYFVNEYPIATKRVTRAILKATDLCVTEPERVARMLVDDGFTENYDYALEALNEVPYDRWREFDPEDTLRFYALRLHEAGMIRSTPQEIIAEGTDWRFLNELKRELKT
jgi:NitT/TauT family transport system substrate-binding protein